MWLRSGSWEPLTRGNGYRGVFVVPGAQPLLDIVAVLARELMGFGIWSRAGATQPPRRRCRDAKPLAKQDAPGPGAAAAIVDYDKAIVIMERLRDELEPREEWALPYRNHLAKAYINQGNAKQSAPGRGRAGAIADYDKAIGIRERLRDN